MAPNRYYDTTTPGTTLEFNLDTVSEPQIPASYNITLLPQQYPYTMLIDWNTASYEVINVTGAPTGAGPYSLPCIRGEDGTTATTHASGAVIVHGISARDYQEPQDHLGSDNAVHGVTGDVVGTTDTQTLTNKTLASPAFTGTPTGLTYTEVGADPAGAAATAQSTAETFATSAVSTETTRAETAEALKLAKAANLSDVASQSTALTNITGSQTSGYYVRSNGSSAALATLQLTDAGSTVWPIAAGNTIVVAASGASAKIKAGADYVCTGTNDQNTINSAISSVASAGGTVRLSAGTFTISAPVTITASSISLEGTGVSTKLNVPEGTDISYAIEITGTGTVEVKIRKLYIQLFAGDSNGTGIYIDTPWSTTDTQHTFEDLYINGCPNNGIQVPASADTRVMLFNRVHVKAVGGNGFYMAYPSVTDSVFTNCIADTTGDSGFFIGGANNWFTNCKSFYCGSSGGNTHGFYIVGYNNYFTGCQAQDNYQSGFYGDNTGDATYGSYGCTFDNCSADSNGQNGGSTYCRGWQVNGAKNWQITGGLAFNRPYGSYWQKYGISVQGTSSDTVINDVLFFGNVTAGLIDTSAGPTYSTSNPTPSWINVQEYAADHTGAIDATASIQAALNAAAEGVTGAYGSVAYLPAGTYKVSAPLTIPQGVTFLGDSGGWAEPSGNYGLGGVPVTGTILMPSSAFTPTSGNGAAVIYLTTGNAQGGQQQIKQISIDGQNAPSSNSIHGIQAYNAVAGVKLRDVLVYGGTSSNLGGNGLDMRPGTNQNPDFWDVAHCKFSSMGGNGVNMNGVSDSYFVSVEATGNTGSNWNITNCGNCRYVGCKGENSGTGQGWFLTAASGFTGELAFTGCTSQFNHLDGWYLTGPGAGMYQFTGIRSVSDGESSGSAFTLTGSFNGTAIFTGVASVPGTSYPADGLHISSLGTSAEVMIANSVIWGYSTATVTDNSGTLLLDPNVVYRTGAIGSPVSVTQALGIPQGGTSATSASAARTALGAAPIVSPTFTGIPLAPTASPLTSNTQIATTAYADSAAATSPQTSSNNVWTGTNVFKGPKPWFDVDAFGADPTGTNDSTLAFNQAIAAALGGQYYNDLGYTGSSTSVTNPSAQLSDLNQYINSSNFSAGYARITAVTANVGYTVSSAATSNLSAQSAFVGYNQTATGQYALGPVHMSAGNYKISSDLNITSVLGFQLVGAGATSTNIISSGTNFTNAVIYVNGSLDSVFEKFAIAGTGTAANAFYLTWNPSTAQRSTSANTLSNIRIRNMNFTAGIRIGASGGGAYQVDGTTLRDIVIAGGQTEGSWSSSGYWQYGFYFGNGISGNQYDHSMYSCSAGTCYYGYYNNASGYQLYGAQPGGNYCDFFENGTVQNTRQGIQSQDAQIFVIGSGGSSTVRTSFRDVWWNGWPSSAPPGNKVISLAGGAAGWEFSNCSIFITGQTYSPVVGLNGNGADVFATFINLEMQNNIASGFAISGTASVVLLNYLDMASNGIVGSMYPLYIYENGVWTNLTVPYVAPTVTTLTDGSTVAVNAALGNDFRLMLTGNAHIIGAPLTPSDGQRILFQITQGSGGPYTVQWATAYQFPSSVPPPTLSTVVGDTDLIGFIYNVTIGQWLYVAVANGFT